MLAELELCGCMFSRCLCRRALHRQYSGSELTLVVIEHPASSQYINYARLTLPTSRHRPPGSQRSTASWEDRFAVSRLFEIASLCRVHKVFEPSLLA